jgi:hypothetical protein
VEARETTGLRHGHGAGLHGGEAVRSGRQTAGHGAITDPLRGRRSGNARLTAGGKAGLIESPAGLRAYRADVSSQQQGNPVTADCLA